MAIVRLLHINRPAEEILKEEVKPAAAQANGVSPLDEKPAGTGEWKEARSNIRVDTDLPEQWTASGVGHAYAPGGAGFAGRRT